MNSTLKTTRDAFAGIVAGVANDSPEQVAAVRTNVERAQADANNAMMGGWVSDVA